MPTTIYKSKYQVPAALPKGENTLPRFRDPLHDTNVSTTVNPQTHQQVPEEYARFMGLDCGRRVLPYSMLDRYDRKLQQADIPSIVMENENLRATFLPTLGGRIISLIDRQDGDRELVYNTGTIQVANLGNRDAWFAGGIEWNLGQYGHAFSSCSPLFSTMLVNGEEPFLRMYDYERCKGLWWHIDFHLPSVSKFLYAHVEVHNLYPEPISMYYWTNMAVNMTDKTRVLASNDHAVYLDPTLSATSRTYGYMEMPHVPVHPDIDASYPKQFPYSDEYFFTCDKDEMPWEAAFGEDGKGVFEASTSGTLAYRKMFCWGESNGGKHWQSFLAPGRNTEYVEIQAGVAPSQQHGMFIDGFSKLSWTQAFGAIAGDNDKIQDKDYHVAKSEASQVVSKLITPKDIEEMNREFEATATIPPTGDFVTRASGWGYLEQKLRGDSLTIPSAFLFDGKELTEAESIWESFLDHGRIEGNPDEVFTLPAVVGPVWRSKLEQAVAHAHDIKDTAVLKHYLGIALLEEENVVAAKQCWLDTYEILPNPWTARNIAALELRRNAVDISLEWYEKAVSMDAGEASIMIAEEYFKTLVSTGRYQQALEYFNTMPENYLVDSDTIALDRAKLAAALGDADTIKTLIIDRQLCNFREGDAPFDEIWKRYCLLRYGRTYPLIEQLDFNLFKVE